MELIKYRDAGMATYTYFWVDEHKRVCSPYFNTTDEAMDWSTTEIDLTVRDDARAEDEEFDRIQRNERTN
jgi:hypothetical protein